ncbi:unnamed protein product [Rotaria sordida]|uniref:Uncharacterized protein n=1 Tax=Rotaria sordida TaxID=392033 RepID=A0A819NMA3_9BILA|nr:unnamed protein product [Rotaria sordida]
MFDEIPEHGEIDGNQRTVLREGAEVLFCVRAVNVVNPGKPNKPTDTITVQDQPEKSSSPDFYAIKDIRVRVGKDFEIHIHYKATSKAQRIMIN